MDRVAVFVDAGAVFAQGSVLLAGKTSTGPTAQHLTLAHLDNVKVRLGFVNSVGEQKGVDSLIVTDMIALARNRVISDAVLVSGDEDLRVGVQQAQEFGVRVHLVGIKPSRGSQSLFLLQEADTTHEWASAEIAGFLACKPKPQPAAPVLAPLTVVTNDVAAVEFEVDRLDVASAKVAGGLERTVLVALVETFEGTRQLPTDIDRQLLAGGRSAIGRDLDAAEKKRVRTGFVEVCRRRLGE